MDQGLPKTVSLVMGFIGLGITKLSDSIIKVKLRLLWEVTAVEYQTAVEKRGHYVLTLWVRLVCHDLNGIFILILYIAIQCSSLNFSNNGKITYSSIETNGLYVLGTVATYSCSPGFGLNGTQSRECIDDGSSGTVGRFSGMEPSCEGRTIAKCTFLLVVTVH